MKQQVAVDCTLSQFPAALRAWGARESLPPGAWVNCVLAVSRKCSIQNKGFVAGDVSGAAVAAV